MKGIPKNKWKYFVLCLIFFLFLSACGGVTPGNDSPLINSFSASSTTITEGESVTLSWVTTGATTVYLKELSASGGATGMVSPSGSKAVSPSETTTYTLTATNDVGSTPAIITVTVNPAAIITQTITIQPGPEEGMDSYVSSHNPASTYGTLPYINMGKALLSSMGVNRANYMYEYMYDYFRAYLQFSLSSLPAGAVIVNAALKLYQFNNSGTEDFMISLHQVTEYWSEGTITWINKPDYISSPERTITVTAGATAWLSWDITDLVQGWLDESITNYGIMLKGTDESSPNVSGCYSSELIPEPALHPKLEVTYYVP